MIMTRFYKHKFRTPIWLDLLSLPVILYFLILWQTMIGYNAGFEARGQYDPQLSQSEVKVSPHRQILPDNGVVGVASWYDYCLYEGYDDDPLKTMCIRWSKEHATAASRTLPRYSYAKVTNLDNGKSVIVYINDYGPEEWTGRDIDLSSYAFSMIETLQLGLANVKIEPLQELSTPNN